MKTDKLKNKFLENSYQNFDAINKDLNTLYDDIQKSIKNKYENLLYSNSKLKWLKTLKSENLFLMNMHDKHILAILNISIYEAIISENYEILYRGILTYNRLRTLNRIHLSGSKFNVNVESLIYSDNFLKQNNHTENLLQQFMGYLDVPNGKFDTTLIQLLENLIKDGKSVDTHFNSLIKLHSKCQWLTKGWYRECNLINFMPIFLVGIYKLINRTFKVETENTWLIDFIHYLEQNQSKKNELIYTFSGKIDFLNSILNDKYDEFYAN